MKRKGVIRFTAAMSLGVLTVVTAIAVFVFMIQPTFAASAATCNRTIVLDDNIITVTLNMTTDPTDTAFWVNDTLPDGLLVIDNGGMDNTTVPGQVRININNAVGRTSYIFKYKMLAPAVAKYDFKDGKFQSTSMSKDIATSGDLSMDITKIKFDVTKDAYSTRSLYALGSTVVVTIKLVFNSNDTSFWLNDTIPANMVVIDNGGMDNTTNTSQLRKVMTIPANSQPMTFVYKLRALTDNTQYQWTNDNAFFSNSMNAPYKMGGVAKILVLNDCSPSGSPTTITQCSKDQIFMTLISNVSDITGGEMTFTYKQPISDKPYDPNFDKILNQAGIPVTAKVDYYIYMDVPVNAPVYKDIITTYQQENVSSNHTVTLQKVESVVDYYNATTEKQWVKYVSGVTLPPGIYTVKAVISWKAQKGQVAIDLIPQTNISGAVFNQSAWTWFATAWQSRKGFNVSDMLTQNIEYVGLNATINITGLALQTNNCTKELRITDWTDTQQQAFITVLNGTTGVAQGSQWCMVNMVVNKSINFRNATYYAYFNNSNPTEPTLGAFVRYNTAEGCSRNSWAAGYGLHWDVDGQTMDICGRSGAGDSFKEEAISSVKIGGIDFLDNRSTGDTGIAPYTYPNGCGNAGSYTLAVSNPVYAVFTGTACGHAFSITVFRNSPVFYYNFADPVASPAICHNMRTYLAAQPSTARSLAYTPNATWVSYIDYYFGNNNRSITANLIWNSSQITNKPKNGYMAFRDDFGTGSAQFAYTPTGSMYWYSVAGTDFITLNNSFAFVQPYEAQMRCPASYSYFLNTTAGSGAWWGSQMNDQGCAWGACYCQNYNFQFPQRIWMGAFRGVNAELQNQNNNKMKSIYWQYNWTGMQNTSNWGMQSYYNVTMFAQEEAGDRSGPNIDFVQQQPADIDTFSQFGNVLNASFSITDPAGVSNATLLYQVNGTVYGVWEYLNGSAYVTGWQSKAVTANTSTIFNWSLFDNDIYPATYNLDEKWMEQIATKSVGTLTDPAQYVKIELLNVSDKTKYMQYEIMANTSTSGTQPGRFYYCNSSYTTGDPTTSNNCVQFANLPAATGYNHTHTATTRHMLLPFAVNTTSGLVNDQVKVTNTSYFLLRGAAPGVDTWNYYYTTNVSRTSAAQISSDNGTTWSALGGTVDSHLHFYTGNEYLYYVATANDGSVNVNFNTSAYKADLINLGGLPPTSPEVFQPTFGFYKGNISIGWTAATSPNGYTIAYYNITLLNRVGLTTNMTIAANTTVQKNLSYVFNSLFAQDGQYVIKVTACDSLIQCSYGLSDNITIYNTAPLVSIITPLPGYFRTPPTIFGSCLSVGAALSSAYTNSTYYAGIDTTPDAFNFGNSSALPDGSLSVRVFCNDSLNNTGSAYTSFILDSQMPFIAMLSPNASSYNVSTLNLVEISSDNIQMNQTWYQIGATNTSLTNGANTTFTAPDGTSNIILWANDSAGNINMSGPFTLNVDLTPPNVSVSNKSSLTKYSPTLKINGSCSAYGIAPLSAVYSNSTYFQTPIMLSGAYSAFQLQNSSAIPDGQQTIYLFCNDTFGNNLLFDTATFLLDSVPPAVFLHSPNASFYNISTIPVLFSATDTNLDKKWFQYNGVNTTLTANTTFTGIPGSNDMILWANDTVGYISATSPFTVRVDLLPPNITADNGTSVIKYSPNIWLQGTCVDTGIAGLDSAYTNDTRFGIDSSPGIWNITNVSAVADSVITVKVTCNDTFGNNFQSTTITFTLDSITPVVSITAPTDGYYKTTPNIVGTCTDTNAQTAYSNGSYYSVDTTPATFSFANVSAIGSGTRVTAFVYCNDTANNTGVASTSFYFDNTLPRSVLFSPNATKYNTSTFFLQEIASDNLQLNTTLYEYAGVNTTIANGANATVNKVEGSNIIRLWVNDSAGNMNKSADFTVNVDTLRPNNTIDNSSPTVNYKPSIVINAHFHDDGIAGLDTAWTNNTLFTHYFTFGGAANGVANFSNISGIPDGQTQVCIFVNDTFNNLNVTCYSFLMDTVTPVIGITSPSRNYYATAQDLVGSCANANPSYTWTNSSYYGGLSQQYACGPFVFHNTTAIPDGDLSIQVIGNDTSNQLGTLDVFYSLDSVKPFVYLFSPNASHYNTSTFFMTEIASDLHLNYTWYQYGSNPNVTIANGANATVNKIEGSNTFILWVNDSTGTNMNRSSFQVLVDTQPPNISSTNETPEVTSYSPTITFNGFCSDQGIAGVDSVYSNSTYFQGVDSTGAVWNLTNTSAIPDVSNLEIYFICNDTFGNNLDFVRMLLTLDTSTPAVDSDFPTDGYYATAQPLDVECDDTGHLVDSAYTNSTYFTQVIQSVGGASIDSVFTNTSNLPDGRYAIRIYCNDTANNTGFFDDYFYIDQTPPFVYMFSPNASYYNTSTFPLLEIASDNIQLNYTWYQYGLNANVTIANGANATVPKIEGSNSFILWANSSSGLVNRSGPFVTNIDTQPPNISVDNVSGEVGYSPTVTIQGACTDQGIAGVYSAWTNNSNFTGYDFSPGALNFSNTSGLPGGENVIYIFCNDSYNNLRVLRYNFSFTYNSAPRTIITYPTNGTIHLNGTVNITWVSDDKQNDTFLTNITLINATSTIVIATNLPNTTQSFLWNSANGTDQLGNYILNVTAFEVNMTTVPLLNYSYVNITLDNTPPHNIVPGANAGGGGGGYPTEYAWVVSPGQILMQMNDFQDTVYLRVNNTGYSAVYFTVDLSEAPFLFPQDTSKPLKFAAYSKSVTVIPLTAVSDLTRNLSGKIKVIPSTSDLQTVNIPVILTVPGAAGTLSFQSSTQQIVSDISTGKLNDGITGMLTSLNDPVGSVPKAGNVPKYAIPVGLTLVLIAFNFTRKKEDRMGWATFFAIFIILTVATALLIPSNMSVMVIS